MVDKGNQTSSARSDNAWRLKVKRAYQLKRIIEQRCCLTCQLFDQCLADKEWLASLKAPVEVVIKWCEKYERSSELEVK